MFLSLYSHGQIAEVDEWNVPWTYVGDSSVQLPRESKIIVTGRVTNSDSGSPVSGALVSADFLKHYDYTDDNGNYVLEVPPGTYRVKIKQLGLLPVYLRVKVFSNGVLNVAMREGVVELTEVLITSRPIDSNIKESLAGLTKLNVQEVKTLPTLMGEVDIVKSIQLMPGVSSVGEGSSGINVRGGRVDQNLVLLNDVPVFNTSHALGFVSAFNQDIIETFSLYKGNVPGNLGGRASSVLQVDLKRGNFDEWKFQGGVGPVSSRLTAEGPLVPKKTSILASGRISHANWFLKRISDPDVSQSQVAFNDFSAGLSHKFNENSSADVNFYSSYDDFRFSDVFAYKWQNHILSARWRSLADRDASPTLSVSYGHFKNMLIDPSGVDASQIANTMNYFQLKEVVNYIPNDDHNVTAGVSAIGYLPGDEIRSGFNGDPVIPRRKAGKSSGLELAAFAHDDFQLTEALSVSAGLRYSLYHHFGADTLYHYEPGSPRSVSSISDTTFFENLKSIKSFGGFEPRISIRYSLRENQSIKVSYNRMRQYIHLISNTTAPTPIDLWQVSTSYTPPQLADNYSLGYFLNLKNNLWETSAEVFYKRMDNLVEYKDFPTLFLNDHLETELLTGKGRAWGAEVFIRRLKGRWTGWLSYTYSNTEVLVSSELVSESINSGDWFPANHNKPHIVNLVLNKNMRKGSAMSFIVTYNSGRPFTAIESSYVVGGTVVPIYSERNKYNIPDYFRADFSLTIGNVFKKVDDSMTFSIYNLFGRENAYSVFYRRPASNFFIPRPYKLSVLGSAFPSLTYNFQF